MADILVAANLVVTTVEPGTLWLCWAFFFSPSLEWRVVKMKMCRGESEGCAYFEGKLQEQGKDGYLQPNWV